MTDNKQKERKTRCRERLKDLRHSNYSPERNKIIVNNFVSSELFKNSEKILLTASFDDEIDTGEIIKKALEMGKKVYLPRVEDERIVAYRIENFPSDLEVGYSGILEPVKNCEEIDYNHELDLILVPGIGFSKNGERIGYGGGYYDRFLPTTVAKRVALSPNELVIDSLPSENFDQKVDYIITEDRTYIRPEILKPSKDLRYVFQFQLS